MNYGIVRVAAAVPRVKPAAVYTNLEEIKTILVQAQKQEVNLLVFPELCLSGYSCGDLFYQENLLASCRKALKILTEFSESIDFPFLVGLPWEHQGQLFNCTAVLCRGQLLALVPKTYLPNSGEYYEQRWFSSARSLPEGTVTRFGGTTLPLTAAVLFESSRDPLFSFGAELCEDLWAPAPPSTHLALQGASILLNPSASNDLVGKGDYRKNLVKQQSARCLSAYVYTSASVGESSTDMVFCGHALIYENGHLLRENHRFNRKSHFIYSDVDLDYLSHERRHNSTFRQNAAFLSQDSPRQVQVISFQDARKERHPFPLARPLHPHPFVPSSTTDRERRCQEIFSIQSSALATRLTHTGMKDVILGLSGGLDSTLALLVCLKAFQNLNLELQGIHCYTMPGFGTTERTLKNVNTLCKTLQLPIETLDIRKLCLQQIQDLKHSGLPEDTAYENIQARQRTMHLMNKANMQKALVVGTGDLSELALGWCTYNADHMSMYSVNCGIPKTLVRYLIRYVADHEMNPAVAHILYDIIDTPISPELLPPDEKGSIAQKTEDVVGPYELHDFFLYYAIRCGFSPKKTFYLSCQAFKDKYSKDRVLKWARVFFRRFFSQQFKRSCLPDGPKVGTIALSPRADWRMPSDASPDCWLSDLEELEETPE